MAVEHYHAPLHLADALEHLRGGEATILAGGTDLMPQSHAGRVKLARVLVNVRRIPELDGIGIEDGEIRIGALATIGYFGLVFSGFWGWVFFGHLPDQWTVIGALVIVGAGIYVWYRERKAA